VVVCIIQTGADYNDKNDKGKSDSHWLIILLYKTGLSFLGIDDDDNLFSTQPPEPEMLFDIIYKEGVGKEDDVCLLAYKITRVVR
jgi:hypothetical protein